MLSLRFIREELYFPQRFVLFRHFVIRDFDIQLRNWRTPLQAPFCGVSCRFALTSDSVYFDREQKINFRWRIKTWKSCSKNIYFGKNWSDFAKMKLKIYKRGVKFGSNAELGRLRSKLMFKNHRLVIFGVGIIKTFHRLIIRNVDLRSRFSRNVIRQVFLTHRKFTKWIDNRLRNFSKGFAFWRTKQFLFLFMIFLQNLKKIGSFYLIFKIRIFFLMIKKLSRFLEHLTFLSHAQSSQNLMFIIAINYRAFNSLI